MWDLFRVRCGATPSLSCTHFQSCRQCSRSHMCHSTRPSPRTEAPAAETKLTQPKGAGASAWTGRHPPYGRGPGHGAAWSPQLRPCCAQLRDSNAERNASTAGLLRATGVGPGVGETAQFPPYFQAGSPALPGLGHMETFRVPPTPAGLLSPGCLHPST